MALFVLTTASFAAAGGNSSNSRRRVSRGCTASNPVSHQLAARWGAVWRPPERDRRSQPSAQGRPRCAASIARSRYLQSVCSCSACPVNRLESRASPRTTTTSSGSTVRCRCRTGRPSRPRSGSRDIGAARPLAYASSRPAQNVSFAIVHGGTESNRIIRNDVMEGHAVRASRPIGSVAPGRELSIKLGNWPSGLYFARLTAPGGRIGYAPFVLEPRKLGEHRVAVVLSTMTWQAYNFRDDDDDGTPDTWYGDPTRNTARLGRPFENRGTPRHYRWYDQPFLRWLNATGRNVDYFSDRGLNLVPSRCSTRAGVRPDRLPRAPRVRHCPRVRHRHRLPQPGRQLDVPFREQLLLPGRPRR